MSKHNYSQYSNNKKKPSNEVKKTNEPEVKMIKDLPKIVTEEIPAGHNDPVGAPGLEGMTPSSVTGIVVDCAKLNVRVAPNALADVVCVLDAQSELEIDVSKSTDEWFKICTAIGAEGYCMRKYIKANL